MSKALPVDREALARDLAQLLQQQSSDTFLDIARLLVEVEDAQLFGNTEFQIRQLLLKLGVTAYNTFLAQKKRL